MKSFEFLRYPVLSGKLFRQIGYTLGQVDYSYTDNQGRHSLKATSGPGSSTSTSVIQLDDDRNIWHPDTSGLDILIEGQIANPSFLFGKNGLLPSDGSSLGLALIWTDREAQIRGSRKITSLSSASSEDFEFSERIHFDPGMLRGTLTLRIVLYVEKTGYSSRASAPEGTTVGVLDEIKVIIEGSGSIFPISEISTPGDPLWYVETYFDDPNEDEFNAENIQIVLNTAHPLYPELQSDSNGLSPLMSEVLASAIYTLVMDVISREEGSEIIRNAPEQARTGSIASILHYMAVSGRWIDWLDQPARLAFEIRRWLEKEK